MVSSVILPGLSETASSFASLEPVATEKLLEQLQIITTAYQDHMSEKYEPMLRHFFNALVDNTSTVFDPTCGSGAAIRAADFCGAARVLGLEINPEYAHNANSSFLKARALRNAK